VAGRRAPLRHLAARGGHEPGRLLVVGTPEDEPWHLTAHLADAARWRSLPSLQPTLVRWQVPSARPPTCPSGLEAVHTAARGTTVLVARRATPTTTAARAARRRPARRGDAVRAARRARAAEALAHESLPLPRVMPALEGFETASHVVATVTDARRRGLPWRRRP
jgi:hypothetical protein